MSESWKELQELNLPQSHPPPPQHPTPIPALSIIVAKRKKHVAVYMSECIITVDIDTDI